METETCSYCGKQIGDRELRQIWIKNGVRLVFHGKTSNSSCREQWTKENADELHVKVGPNTTEQLDQLQKEVIEIKNRLDLLEKKSGRRTGK